MYCDVVWAESEVLLAEVLAQLAECKQLPVQFLSGCWYRHVARPCLHAPERAGTRVHRCSTNQISWLRERPLIEGLNAVAQTRAERARIRQVFSKWTKLVEPCFEYSLCRAAYCVSAGDVRLIRRRLGARYRILQQTYGLW